MNRDDFQRLLFAGHGRPLFYLKRQGDGAVAGRNSRYSVPRGMAEEFNCDCNEDTRALGQNILDQGSEALP